MKKVECEHSIKLNEHFTIDESKLSIVMELCDTDLSKLNRTFTEVEAKEILRQLNVAFEQMVKNNIIHRDIKLNNVLLKYNKDTEGKGSPINFKVKLTDYGLSKLLEEDKFAQTLLGTPTTIAPEMWEKGKKYTNKVDLWAIGIIAYQLLFNRHPIFTRLKDNNDVQIQLRLFSEVKIPEGYKVSEEALSLLTNLIEKNPEKRLSWGQYFTHPFFKINVNYF
jgi:serine/threonine protein kinase